MPRLNASVFAENYLGAYRRHHALVERRMEAAAIIATDEASRLGLRNIRTAMQSARLGRLGNALGQTSDMQRGGLHRRGDGYSASGIVFIRSRSDRTRGAIESYTEGSVIRPRRGRYLWIATDEIPRVTNRRRMTPELYRRNGYEQKIGPLIFARSASGTPLYLVKDVGLSEVGKPRSARSLTKSGRPRKGQYQARAIVAFYGIPHTARAARIDVRAIMREVQADLPRLFQQALDRTAK